MEQRDQSTEREREKGRKEGGEREREVAAMSHISHHKNRAHGTVTHFCMTSSVNGKKI